MKTKSFKIGDKVFAKVKGFPFWPAKIESLDGKRYNVVFYGTGEVGKVKPEDLHLYAENKEKFPKSSKRLAYNEGIKEIEDEITSGGGGGGGDTVLETSETVATEKSTASTSRASTTASKSRASLTVSKTPKSSKANDPLVESKSKPGRKSKLIATAKEYVSKTKAKLLPTLKPAPKAKPVTEKLEPVVDTISVIDLDAEVGQEDLNESVAAIDTVSITEPEPEVEPNTSVEPEAVIESESAVESEAVVELEPVIEPKSVTEPEPVAKLQTVTEHEHEPVVESVSGPEINTEQCSLSKSGLIADQEDTEMELNTTIELNSDLETGETDANSITEELTITANHSESTSEMKNATPTLTENHTISPVASPVLPDKPVSESITLEDAESPAENLVDSEHDNSSPVNDLISNEMSDNIPIILSDIVIEPMEIDRDVKKVERMKRKRKHSELSEGESIDIDKNKKSNSDSNEIAQVGSTIAVEVQTVQSNIVQSPTSANRPVKSDFPMEEERRDIVSRSGRKIKPKKYLDDEDVTEHFTTARLSPQVRKIQKREPEVPIVVNKDVNVNINNTHSNINNNNNNNINNNINGVETSPQASFGNHLYISEKRIQFLLNKAEIIEVNAKKRNITNVDVSEDELRTSLKEILLVKLPNESNYIGIKFKLNRPRQFKNELERWQWDKESMKNALGMKKRMENNESTIDDANKEMLVLNLTLSDQDILRNERLQTAKSKDNRISCLKTELAFVSSVENIKLYLGLVYETVDTKKAIELLDSVISIKSNLNAIIIKKHPETVEIIKKLRFYIGNAKDWTINDEQLNLFNQEANVIREKSTYIYKYLQQLCHIPEPLSFCEEYCKQVNVFNESVKDFTDREKLALTSEPFSMEYFSDQFDDEAGKVFEELV